MSEETYKSLFENSFSVMFILNPETGCIIDANKAACNFYGYKKDELINMAIHDINTLSEEQVFKEIDHAENDRKRSCA